MGNLELITKYQLPEIEFEAIKGIFEEYNLGNLNKESFEKYFSIWPKDWSKIKEGGEGLVAICNLNNLGLKKFSDYILNLENLNGLYLSNNNLVDLPEELILLNLSSIDLGGNPLSKEGVNLLQKLKLYGTNVFR